MVRDVDFAAASWIRGSDAPDPNGPLDIPYTPYDEAWFNRPVVEVIGEVASRLGSHVAVDDGTTRLTYAQLYAMACRLSHAIKQADLPPGPIGVKLQDDALYVVAMVACLASGRACMLLSRDNPPDYNRRLIGISGLRALLVNATDTSSDGDGVHLIPVEPAMASDEYDGERPAGRLGVDEPAFIVSTSGSTGTPKLIARSQRGLHKRVRVNVDAGHFNEDDRILVLGAPAIGAAISRRFLPLLIGAALHIVDVPRAGMGGILKTLREARITTVRTTSSLVKALMQLDDAASYVAGLRMVWCGGEMLLQKDLAQIRAILPSGCRLGNSLNMTEASVARWCIPEKDEHDPIRVAVGYVAPSTEVLVLDDEGHACAPGDIGELIVRSESVALGEWRDGQLQPDRFQRDSTEATKRIYRTGDMVRICADGVMVMHGRKDRMIKIRGQRVEPAVVEASMRNVPGVADAAVVAKPVDGGYRIYGFVVPQRDDASRRVKSSDLPVVVREALAIALPSYMRPYDILVLDALPISVSSKVDTQALLQRVASASDDGKQQPMETARQVARNPASARSRDWVAEAWRVAFGAGGTNPTLGFDAAGGDSLQFMQIIFRLEQLSGVSLPLGTFDISMSQDDMAGSLDRLLGGGRDAPEPGQQIFFLPGVGGDEPRLLQFRAGCAPDVSFACLDYGSWPQWVEPGFRFETLIRGLAARIQELAPTGPLSLCGYSLGGQVALALAEALCAAGREIETVLILDSEAIRRNDDTISARRAVFIPPLTLREEYKEWRAASRRGEGAFSLALIATRRLVSPRWAPLLRWLARHRRTVLPGQIDFYLSFHLQRSLLLNLAVDWRRSLRAIPRVQTPITIFRARERKHDADHDTAWEQHSPRVTVMSVGGDHYTMFDPPNLTDLCARFTAACTVKPARERAIS